MSFKDKPFHSKSPAGKYNFQFSIPNAQMFDKFLVFSPIGKKWSACFCHNPVNDGLTAGNKEFRLRL